MLAKTVERGGKDWDQRLPFVLFTYWASQQLKLGSQYAAQLHDAAKHVMPHRVCREFRLRVYTSNVATRSQYMLPHR